MAHEGFQLEGNAAEIYEAQKVRAIFGPLARATLDAVSLGPADRVLDLACGTGIMARTIRDRLGPSVRLAGVDLNEGMIATARRLTMNDPGEIRWHVADAGELPFEAGTFSVVFCQQGIQFFPDEARAVAEMRRVLEEGGRLFLTIWAGPNAFFEAMADAIARHVDPQLGERSLAPFRYGRHGELLDLLKVAGFSNVSGRRLTVERVITDPESSIENEIMGNPVGPTVHARGADTMRTIVSEIIRDCEPYRSGTALVFPQQTHLISAHVQSE